MFTFHFSLLFLAIYLPLFLSFFRIDFLFFVSTNLFRFLDKIRLGFYRFGGLLSFSWFLRTSGAICEKPLYKIRMKLFSIPSQKLPPISRSCLSTPPILAFYSHHFSNVPFHIFLSATFIIRFTPSYFSSLIPITFPPFPFPLVTIPQAIVIFQLAIPF